MEYLEIRSTSTTQYSAYTKRNRNKNMNSVPGSIYQSLRLETICIYFLIVTQPN